MSIFVQSMELQQFSDICTFMQGIVQTQDQRCDIQAEISMYSRKNSLLLKNISPDDKPNGRFVHVIVEGKEQDKLVVTFFGSKDVFTNPLPATTDSTGGDFVLEVTFNQMSTLWTDVKQEKKMAEVAKLIADFIREGEQMVWDALDNVGHKYPVLSKRVESSSVPKLR